MVSPTNVSSYASSQRLNESLVCFFFFNDTATTEIYPLSLHDALPISDRRRRHASGGPPRCVLWGRSRAPHRHPSTRSDRKSTRLNSSHQIISYAVFSLKKKNN